MAQSVQVAVRVRPLATLEILHQATECIACVSDTEILMGADRAFSFDQVHDGNATQQDVYEGTVASLVDRFLDGYNATVLAYGQTGSGKTYSMGTGLDTLATTTTTSGNASNGFSVDALLNGNPPPLSSDMDALSGMLLSDPELEGIIPRAAQHVFTYLQQMVEQHPDAAYEVRVSFLELYNEELIDLLHPRSGNKQDQQQIQIREDGKGGIEWVGVRQVQVHHVGEIMEVLRKGTLARRTGSTDMNLTSSRSHAVFSIQVWQRKPAEEDLSLKLTESMRELEHEKNEVGDENDEERPGTGVSAVSQGASQDPDVPQKEMRTLTSKFHFVDLAGSERLKKTNATGERKKEGIAINSGLLALGNVISALVDRAMAAGKKEVHVPYRDSKLTRLLQDSLGGNSQTTMLACVSPADTNFAESLSTLRYASRARKIQNRARVNMEDPAATAAEVAKLKKLVARLQIEVENLRLAAGDAPVKPARSNRRTVPGGDAVGGPDEGRRVVLESQLFKSEFEINRLRDRVRELEDECIQARAERDTLLFKQQPTAIENKEDDTLDETPDTSRLEGDEEDESIHPMILHYVKRISELESKYRTSEDEVAYWRELYGRGSRPPSAVPSSRAGSALDVDATRALNSRLRIPTPQIMDASQRTLAGSRLRMVINASTSSEPSPSRQGTPDGMTDTGTVSDGDMPRPIHGRPRSESVLSFVSDQLMATPSLEDLNIPVWDPENQTEDEYLEDILSRINSSIVMREGLMQQIEALQQALIMKEDLLEELEDARFEQAMLVEKYEEKIAQLAEKLHVLERERDDAIKKITTPSYGSKDKMTPELRWQYENKMKALVNEISGLRKDSTNAARSMEANNKQTEFTIRSLKQNVEHAKVEKTRLLQRMRDLEERSRETSQASQREIQALRRKERQATEKSQKLQRQLDMQKIMMKRQQEESAIMMNKMRILVKTLDKQHQAQLRTSGRQGNGSAGRRATLSNNHRGSSVSQLRAASRDSRSQSWRRNSTGAALAAEIFGEPDEDENASGIRVSFKKQLLEREVTLSVAKRQIVSVLQDLMLKRKRLLDEKTALLEERELIIREEAEELGTNVDRNKPRYMDDRIELIDAEAAFLAARIRGLRLEATQMKLAEAEGEGPLGRDVGYDNAVNMLMSLSWQDARRMARLLLDDVIRLRVEHWSKQMFVTEMERGMMDLRRTLLVMRKTAITAAAEYEKRLRSMEQALIMATSPDGMDMAEMDQFSDAGTRTRSNSMTSLPNESTASFSMLNQLRLRADTIATNVITEADLISNASMDTAYRRMSLLDRQPSIESAITMSDLGGGPSPSSPPSVSGQSVFGDPTHPATVYDRIYERGILSRAVRSIEDKTSPSSRRRAYTCRSDGYFQFNNIGKIFIPSVGTPTEGGSPSTASRSIDPVATAYGRLQQRTADQDVDNNATIGAASNYFGQDSSRPPSPAASITSVELREWWSQDAEKQLFDTGIASPTRTSRMVLPVAPPKSVANVVAKSPPKTGRPISWASPPRMQGGHIRRLSNASEPM